MKILILGKSLSAIAPIIRKYGDEVLEWEDSLEVHFVRENQIDFVISYGYRHIIRSSIIDCFPNCIINLHISYLPWNRGADPNLWSFLEDTPKGISIHFVDEGIDTGDIIVQREVNFSGEGETLFTTYQKLQDEMIQLFKSYWPKIRAGQCPRQKQATGGTFHKTSDRKRIEPLLVKGWDTSVDLLKGKALHEKSVH